jgi:hypothetical protein
MLILKRKTSDAGCSGLTADVFLTRSGGIPRKAVVFLISEKRGNTGVFRSSSRNIHQRRVNRACYLLSF